MLVVVVVVVEQQLQEEEEEEGLDVYSRAVRRRRRKSGCRCVSTAGNMTVVNAGTYRNTCRPRRRRLPLPIARAVR